MKNKSRALSPVSAVMPVGFAALLLLSPAAIAQTSSSPARTARPSATSTPGGAGNAPGTAGNKDNTTINTVSRAGDTVDTVSNTAASSGNTVNTTVKTDKTSGNPNGPTVDATNSSENTGSRPAVIKEETIKLSPNKISVTMGVEDIVCTNDVALAKKQVESYPDSPEASFIYAVALSRTANVESALKEVRRARRLAEGQGGPGYFDQMIESYEKMLTYYPDDNQVRYHLAWAYYMKAYVLAKYAPKASNEQKYKEWIEAAQAQKVAAPKDQSSQTAQGGTSVLSDLGEINRAVKSAPKAVTPQIANYYALATAKLDDLLARDPGDLWARIYRAHLTAEASGNVDSALAEWQKVREIDPTNPAPYFFLGQGYLKKGNLKECLFNVSKAVSLRGPTGQGTTITKQQVFTVNKLGQ